MDKGARHVPSLTQTQGVGGVCVVCGAGGGQSTTSRYDMYSQEIHERCGEADPRWVPPSFAAGKGSFWFRSVLVCPTFLLLACVHSRGPAEACSDAGRSQSKTRKMRATRLPVAHPLRIYARRCRGASASLRAGCLLLKLRGTSLPAAGMSILCFLSSSYQRPVYTFCAAARPPAHTYIHVGLQAGYLFAPLPAYMDRFRKLEGQLRGPGPEETKRTVTGAKGQPGVIGVHIRRGDACHVSPGWDHNQHCLFPDPPTPSRPPLTLPHRLGRHLRLHLCLLPLFHGLLVRPSPPRRTGFARHPPSLSRSLHAL